MREKKRRRVPEGEPCAVCQDIATGYHYGVASCNGCKTFFRRTIVSEHTFVCQYQGNCDVTKNIRCACRHCRFNKCISVGMDAKAIQNDRDRIGPSRRTTALKIEMKQPSSSEDERFSLSPQRTLEDKIVEQLTYIEELCNILRKAQLPDVQSVKCAMESPSLVYVANDLGIDPATQFKDYYPATMPDIQMWNKRELRVCLEWVKTFEEFQKLCENDRMSLVHNFAFTFNILNRVFYSLDKETKSDRIIYGNGAYILRQTQETVRIPGCRPIYHRQMDEIMKPFRELQIDNQEFACFKATIFFNPDACDLTPTGKIDVQFERQKYLGALFQLITSKMGTAHGALKFGQLLMMSASIQNIIAQNEENMQVMEVFQNTWRIDRFVRELCLKEH